MKKQIILLAFIALASLTYAQEVLTEKGGAPIAVAARLEVQEVYQTMSKGQKPLWQRGLFNRNGFS